MNDESQDSKSEVEEPLPWEHGPAARLIMDEMGIVEIDGDSGHWMFTAKCVGFTVESKARPGEYEMVRGYQNFEADYDLRLPIHNPHRFVNDEAGNLDLLSQVFRTIAKTLDMDVYTVASGRVDVQVAKKDAEAATKARRYDAGKGVVKAQTGETL